MGKTRLAWASEHSENARYARMGSDESPAGWRSHTFADGISSLTLIGPLDVALAGRLWTRISELIERGGRRLIVDASTIDPTGEQPALLASVFVGRPPSYQAVVVAPPASALVDLLPRGVGVTLSLSDARRQLASGIVRHRRSSGPVGPAGRIPPAERHALATRQSLRWAERAAREGDFERALSWLSMLERVEGGLPERWRRQRKAWVAAWAAQTTAAQSASVRRSGSARRP
jgi:hypothetical protein